MRPKKKLLIDTSWWFRMVEDHRSAPLLNVVEEMLVARSIELVVPEQVFVEFKRRRADVSKRTTSSLTTHIKAVREALPRISVNPQTMPVVLAYLAEMAQRVHLSGTGAEGVLDRIELILKAHVTKDSPDMLSRAGERARDGKAPCHDKNRNSFGDAVILEAYIEALAHNPPGLPSAFVTYNDRDFSKQGADKRFPHDDLAAIFSGDSGYFIDLLEALRYLDPTTVSETMLRVDPTVRDVIDEYVLTVKPRKDGGPPTEAYNLRKAAAGPLGEKNASTLQAPDILDFCALRLGSGVKPVTLRQDFGSLRSAFALAAKRNPNITLAAFDAAKSMMKKLNMIAPKETPESVRLSKHDIERLLAGLEESDKHPRSVNESTLIAKFTLASALQVAEICLLQRRHLRQGDQSCEVHGRGGVGRMQREPFRLHFGKDAWAIIQEQPPSKDGRIFPYNAHSLSARI